MNAVLLAATSTSGPSPTSGDAPPWTDTGGFVLALISLILAVAVAIVGWVQIRSAKGDARIAREQADAATEQADAAKSLAESAQRQTAAAERSAQAAEAQVDAARAQIDAAEKQAKSALEALDHEREASLVVRVKSSRVGGTTAVIPYHKWRVENHGRSYANEVRAFLNFDEDQREYGAIRLGDIAPDGEVEMKGKKGLPSPASLFRSGPGNTVTSPWVTLEYKLADGSTRTVKVRPVTES